MDKSYKYMVSDKHRFVITEIMKSCTGTLRGIFELYPKEDYGVRHITVIQKSPEVDALIRKGYRSMAVARNPFARLVSCWFQKIHNYHDEENPENVGISHELLNKKTTFPEFVRFVCDTADEDSDSHFRSVYTSIHEGTEILRAEAFDFEFAIWREKIKIPLHRYDIRNQTVNINGRKPYKDYYTPELISMVSERYKEDLEMFGYSFSF